MQEKRANWLVCNAFAFSMYLSLIVIGLLLVGGAVMSLGLAIKNVAFHKALAERRVSTETRQKKSQTHL